MIIVTVNGCVFDLAKDTYHDTCVEIYKMFDMTQEELRVLQNLGEVQTKSAYIEVYEE